MPPQPRRQRRTTDQHQRPTRIRIPHPTSAPARPTSAPTRPSRRERVVEKVDYTQDYESVRRDLKRIAFWSFWLFLGMFVWYFVS